MTEMTKHSPSPETSPSNSAEERKYPFIFLSAANVIRAATLLTGAGFFCLILLLGMGIATHLSSPTGAGMTMGFAILMSALISILTYYTTVKIHQFKDKIYEQVEYSMSSGDLLSLQTQMQKLLKILLALQKELETKEKNSNINDHSSGN